MMLLPPDDYAKRRLTEPAELTVAAEFLIARGFGSDKIAVQLSRFSYVDIDALNDVVSNMSDHGGKARWRHVS
mgnify:CR=1 FL=1